MEGDKSCFFEIYIPKCHLSPGLDRDEVARHHQASRNALGSPRTSADKSLTHSPGPTACLPGCTSRTAPRRQLRVIPHTPHQIRHVLAVSKPLINSCCNRSWHLITKLTQPLDLILPLDLIASLVLPRGTGAEQRALLWGKSTARARGWAASRGCSPELRLNTGISMQLWGRGAWGHTEGFASSGPGVTGESQSRGGNCQLRGVTGECPGTAAKSRGCHHSSGTESRGRGLCRCWARRGHSLRAWEKPGGVGQGTELAGKGAAGGVCGTWPAWEVEAPGHEERRQRGQGEGASAGGNMGREWE